MVIAYIDVDDTLVRSFGSKRIPMTAVITKVRELHAAGVVMYCWSAGGADYARESAIELGLAECFVGYLPKPHIMVDDQLPTQWRTTTCLHPNEACSRSVAELIAPHASP